MVNISDNSMPGGTVGPPAIAKNLKSAIIPIGTRVWPIKLRGMENAQLRKWLMMYVDESRRLTKNVSISEFMELPDQKKFVRFVKANQTGRSFVIALFPNAVHEKTELDPNTYTMGFLFDSIKATDVQMKDGTHVMQPPSG